MANEAGEVRFTLIDELRKCERTALELEKMFNNLETRPVGSTRERLGEMSASLFNRERISAEGVERALECCRDIFLRAEKLAGYHSMHNIGDPENISTNPEKAEEHRFLDATIKELERNINRLPEQGNINESFRVLTGSYQIVHQIVQDKTEIFQHGNSMKGGR